MSLPPIHPSASSTPVPLDRLAAHPQLQESEKIAEAARQFEAVLLRQIITAARRTVIPSDINESSTASGVYDDMINDQLATTISRTGAFGLANALQAQWQTPSHTQPDVPHPRLPAPREDHPRSSPTPIAISHPDASSHTP
jgi:peptidoglycan hydrolase FlgJ